MARKKVKLQWIVNDTARKATYKKRVNGLMKKVKELSILCGVEACAVTYSQYHQQPEIWPSRSEIEGVLAEFRSRPENDQTKKILNQENFTWQRITKARDDLIKQQKKSRKTEIEHLRTLCLAGKPLEGLDSRDLSDLMWAIDDHLEAVKHGINLVPRPQAAPGVSSSSNNVIGGVADGRFHGLDAVAGTGGVSGFGATQKTSFELAIDALESQILMEQNQKKRNMDNRLGDPEMLPLGCDVSNIWRNPFIN